MLLILRIVNLILIVILTILLYKNRKMPNQKFSIALFAVILGLFVYSLIAF